MCLSLGFWFYKAFIKQVVACEKKKEADALAKIETLKASLASLIKLSLRGVHDATTVLDESVFDE